MKTRFAPSPTGYLHLGNIRTALFCALLAQKEQGVFLLRIEDTDRIRSGEEFAVQLQYDLQWLGITWQEGPVVGGSNEPYFQSKRQKIYDEYYQLLKQKGLVYPCFCSEQELAISRKVQLAAGLPPRYPGTCRELTPEQIASKNAQGLKPTLRFHVPDQLIIEYIDFVRGSQRFLSNDIGDFVIRRGDGTAAFFFCNAIDDAVMGVTHVLRGEDHQTNTPRQLMILQALDLPHPNYGHMAMVVGPDGSPLSKRHGSRSIKVLHKQGYLPLAINNYLARVGHYYADPGFMSMGQLAQNFSTENIGTAPARYDPVQLLYWQKQAVQHLEKNAFWEWVGPEIETLVPIKHHDLFIETIQTNVTFPEDVKQWAEIFFAAELDVNDEASTILSQTDHLFFQTALTAVSEFKTDFKAIAQKLQKTFNIKGKQLFQPLRIALTGRLDGPEMAKITELIGIEQLTKRFQKAIEKNSG